MALLEFKPQSRKRRRRGEEPQQMTLFDALAEAIETVNSRAARRLPDAEVEQQRLIDLLQWSIKMVEISKARASGRAAQEPEVDGDGE
jgi:hypothetical protein